MLHHRLPTLAALVLFSALCTVEGRSLFGPGEAAGRPKARVDFKVVVWYRYSDSLGTFKFEIYDLRKGEYTAKVDDWVKLVQTKFPQYYVVVREVDLTREQGQTDLLRVGKVIDREVVVAAGRAGIVIGSGRIVSGPVGSGVFGGAPAVGSSRASGLGRVPRSPGGNRDYLNPSPTPFPVPVPFPRLPR